MYWICQNSPLPARQTRRLRSPPREFQSDQTRAMQSPCSTNSWKPTVLPPCQPQRSSTRTSQRRHLPFDLHSLAQQMLLGSCLPKSPRQLKTSHHLFPHQSTTSHRRQQDILVNPPQSTFRPSPPHPCYQMTRSSLAYLSLSHISIAINRTSSCEELGT